jgi:hypothetical protein
MEANPSLVSMCLPVEVVVRLLLANSVMLAVELVAPVVEVAVVKQFPVAVVCLLLVTLVEVMLVVRVDQAVAVHQRSD